MNKIINPVIKGNDDEFLIEFYDVLKDSQEPMPTDFDKVLYENLWELYEEQK